MVNRLIKIAGVAITVRGLDAAADDIIKVALSSMQYERVQSIKGTVLSLKLAGSEWQLEDHASGLRHSSNQAGDAIYYLTDRIAFHIADQAKNAHCLHAAAVSKGASAFVIPAVSGSGKSTFTAWLVSNGFEYISDELTLVGSHGLLEGLCRPIQIKPQGLAAIDELLINRAMIKSGRVANSVPAASFSVGELSGAQHRAVTQEAKKLTAFIFPAYGENTPFLFEKLSSAQAGMKVMATHVNSRNLKDHGFSEIMSLVRNTPSYSLAYSGFASLPDGFPSQLGDLL